MQTQSVAMLLILLVAGGEATKLAQPVQWSRLIDFGRFTGLGETAFINQYIDETLPHIRNFMVEHELEPMALPSMEEGFSVRPVLVTYSARVELTNGKLTNMVSVRRSGDAVMSYFAHMLRIRLEFGLQDLEFNYDYVAKVMEIGPRGGVVGSLDSINVVVDLLLDFNNDELHLQQFNLTYGRLRVRVNGNFLIDWFVSPMVGLFTRLFDDVIMRHVERTIHEEIQVQVTRFNTAVKEVMDSLE